VSVRACRGAVRVAAVEGLAFLVATLVVVAALAVGLASARQRIDGEHRATANALRRIAVQLEAVRGAGTRLPDTGPVTEGHYPAAATAFNPTPVSGDPPAVSAPR